MESGKFFVLVILVSLVAGVFSVINHLQGVDAANAQLIEAKSKLAQLRETFNMRQGEWAKIEAVVLKGRETAAKEVPLSQELGDLKVKCRRLEGDFKYLVNSMRSAVQKIRSDAVGTDLAEVRLTNGKVLKSAKIRRMDPLNISFIHSDGFTIVPYDVLPDDIREKFDLGGDGLVEQLAAAEQAIQTAKHSLLASSTRPAAASRDQIGTAGMQTMQGLTINCPMPFSSVETQSPPGIRQMLGWEAKDGTKGIKVTVGVADGFQGTTFSFDGGLARAIEQLEKSGITRLSKSGIDLKISDLPAKKYSISGLSQGQPIFMELMIIVKELRTYTILAAFFGNPEAREMANAILSSAKVD